MYLKRSENEESRPIKDLKPSDLFMSNLKQA